MAHRFFFTGFCIVLILAMGTWMTACDDDETTLPPPAITSVMPNHGRPGDIVVITGSNFVSGSLTRNSVQFNGVAAEVRLASDRQLTVIVPATTTGKVTAAVGGNVATSVDEFEVLVNIPLNGLVAFYPFDGAADDMAGIYRPSTLVNGPTLTTDRYSRSGYAYSFDGIDDYITISYAKGLGAWNNTTISGWINTAVEDKDMNIIQRTTADGHVGHTLSQISPGSDGNIYPAFNVLIHAPDPSHLAGGKIPVSSWTFFAVVIREGSATFYQDGAVVSWGNLWTKIVDSTQGTNLIIGGNSSYFNGKIDDIAIYNRELTVDEMDQLYRQTITKY